MMKHILVTGGAGFIGSNTVRYARDKGLTVSVLDSFENAVISKHELLGLGVRVHELDIQNCQAIESISGQIDVIVHLAGVNRANSNEEVYSSNIEINNSLRKEIS